MNKYGINKISILLFLFFSFTTLSAQNIMLSGVVQDSLQKPIDNANILAIPESSDLNITFSISDSNGNYKLKLHINQDYEIIISHLGYNPQTIKLTTVKNDIQQNFNLSEKVNRLDEVLIKHTIPIVIKKDTITFHTDAFTTGEERKLRDVLKRLPMIEVDRDGNVTVQGKKVTKLLVENKEFFTGDSKLAVNNIPADVIDKVEVLDYYNEIGFLKGLEDSYDMAINIKLKENKKKFVFGDIDAGGGIKDRYLIHPSLYYYSPKTSINAIGDFNNTGVKNFTFKDFLEFEGDISALLTNAKSYFSFLNDGFAQIIGNQDFITSRNQFGALSLTQTINSKIELSTYGIWSGMRIKTETQSLNNYFTSDNLIENRNNKRQQNSRFGIGKLKLKLKPNTHTDMTFSTFVKASSSCSDEKISTITEDNSNSLNTITNADNVSFKEDIQWHQQFNKKQILSTVFNYHYQKATPNTNWLTEGNILQGLIPIVNEDLFDIFKVEKSSSHNINSAIKYYLVLDRINHIYFTLGTQLTFDYLETSEYQQLENGTTNNFSVSGFGNDVGLNFKDVFFGIHYKVQTGKITFKPGFFYHFYYWKIDQSNETLDNNKAIILPELTTNIEFNSTKKLNFNYNLNVRFPSILQFADRLTLLYFNSIYKGNGQLENELYHHFRMRYNRFRIFKDLFYNFNVSYRFKEDNFKNTARIQGIDIVSSPILAGFEDKVWNFGGSLKKGLGKFKASIDGNVSLANYEKPINNEIISNTSNTYVIGSKLETHFKTFPNLELEYTKSISEYKANTSTVFQKDVFSAFLEYDFLNDFIFKADYSFENYKNKTSNAKSTFDLANTSLFYQKEDTPWGFEISANNIFDIAFKQRNSFSSILVSDEKTFILPRIIMFKLSYKL